MITTVPARIVTELEYWVDNERCASRRDYDRDGVSSVWLVASTALNERERGER